MERLTAPVRSRRTPARPVVFRVAPIATALAVSLVLGVDVLGLLQSIPGVAKIAVGLGAVIFLHELGHFAVAKWCGVKVERFAIGFGRAIVAKTYGETEYALCALPLGGYVKMLGQDDIDASQMADEEIREDPRSYTAKSVPQRMAIISAGVIMNVITGAMFFMVAYWMGIEEIQPIVGQAVNGSPAWQQGMTTGDRITEVNGYAIDDFSDLIRATALSSGPLSVRAITREGDEYAFTTDADETGERRQLGIVPMTGTLIYGGPDEPTSYATLPADGLELRDRDRIVKVDDRKIEDAIDLFNALDDKRAETVTLTIERAGQSSPLTFDLPPHQRREFGFQLAAEPIDTVVRGSVADRKELEVGDRIAKVDGQAVGVEIDPLDLPDYFAERAGQPVVVTIVRDVDGSVEEVDRTLTPDPSRPWMSPAALPGHAMAIPSLGVTMPLTRTVLQVDEGSPAAEEGLKPGDEIVSVTLPASADTFDAFGGSANVLDLREAGWPYASHLIQLVPERPLLLVAVDAETGEEKTIGLGPKFGDRFLAGDRGLRLYRAMSRREADGAAEAIAMGLQKARDSATDIFLTFRSLKIFGGSLSAKNLSGPIGIFRMGYEVQKNGLADLLVFLGILSINLAVVNFLPIPLLDGGHMVFLLWELLTGKPPSERVIIYATIAGACLVVSLMLFVIGLDLTNLSR